MRAERLCEMTRQGETDGTMAYTLTDLGRPVAGIFWSGASMPGPRL